MKKLLILLTVLAYLSACRHPMVIIVEENDGTGYGHHPHNQQQPGNNPQQPTNPPVYNDPQYPNNPNTQNQNYPPPTTTPVQNHPPAQGGQMPHVPNNPPQLSSPYAPDMVYIEGGTFQMGSNYGESFEQPVHTVTLNGFMLSSKEVTQSQWQRVMGSNPSYFNGCFQCPVENVSWSDAQAYINKLNKLTGGRNQYRLPTEAEWEYAARGGATLQTSGFSGNANNIGPVSWFDANSRSRTHPVAQKQPNELGLYDMTGNVAEWCSDWYGPYPASAQNNPSGAMYGEGRVIRGGNWLSNPKDSRTTKRRSQAPDFVDLGVGFRVAANKP